MTPLSDALTAAQRRALAALEKAYSEHDALDDQLREERSLGGAESPHEGTEA